MGKRRLSFLFLWHPLSIFVLIARIFFALYMFVSPVWGYIWTVAFDYVDAIVWLHTLHISKAQYQYVDKILDFVYFLVMLVIGSQYGVFFPLVVLFVYRLIGQVIFMKNQDVRTFVFFPNVFELLFVWTVLGTITEFTNGMTAGETRIWILVLFLIKEGHEIFLHYVLPKYLRANHLDERPSGT